MVVKCPVGICPNIISEFWSVKSTYQTCGLFIQPDQINMALFFWYLLKSDLSSASYCTRVNWTSHFLQDTRNTRPCITDLPVQCTAIRSFSPTLCLKAIIWSFRDEDNNLDQLYKFTLEWQYNAVHVGGEHKYGGNIYNIWVMQW